MARLGRFVRFDSCRTEHHDRVPYAFFLELDQRMKVLPENADGARRRAIQEPDIFMGWLRGVLRLQSFAVGHGSGLQER